MLRPADSTSEDHLEALLETVNPQICDLVRSKVPRKVIPAEVLDLEIDELVQRVRIKLWQALRDGRVQNLKAYLRCIVSTECVDMVRRYKKAMPLLCNEEGEIFQGSVMMIDEQESQDPAEAYERQESLDDSIELCIYLLLHLPKLQRRALLTALKDRIADTLPLLEEYARRGPDLEQARWSENAQQLKSQRSSLSIARKKVRILMAALARGSYAGPRYAG
jgi:DNA-directed RNA polymerase specialized sigma24 family protein